MSQRARLNPGSPGVPHQRALLPSAIELTPPQQQMPRVTVGSAGSSTGSAGSGGYLSASRSQAKSNLPYVMTPFRAEIPTSMPTPQSLDRALGSTSVVNTPGPIEHSQGSGQMRPLPPAPFSHGFTMMNLNQSLPSKPLPSDASRLSTDASTDTEDILGTQSQSEELNVMMKREDADPQIRKRVRGSSVATTPSSKRARPRRSCTSENDDDLEDDETVASSSNTPNNNKPAVAQRMDSYREYIRRQKKTQGTQDRVWCPNVESAFMEAVWLMPRHSCKVTVNDRQRGRNELISDFIFARTQEQRTRKQVSSHIQVLKKVLKDDSDFMSYMAPPTVHRGTSALQVQTTTGEDSEIDVPSFHDLVVHMVRYKQSEPLPTFVRQHAHVVGGLTPLVECPQVISSLATPPPLNAAAPVRPAVQGKPLEISMPSTPSVAATSKEPAVVEVPALRHPRPVEPSLSQFRFPGPVSGVNVSPPLAIAPPPPPPTAPPIAPHAGHHHLSGAQTRPSHLPGHLHGHHHHHRHHRTASASIDLGSDRILPDHFAMARRDASGMRHAFTRLIRANYESPMRPRLLDRLRPAFPALSELPEQSLLAVQVVHGTVRVALERNSFSNTSSSSAHSTIPGATGNQPAPGSAPTNVSEFAADAQFIVQPPPGAARDKAWSVSTVISSRSGELLRGEQACNSTEILGRPYERVVVPLRPDFWSEFLRLISSGTPASADDALGALRVVQFVTCATETGRELAFVILYEFELAEDEFSGRTIFRRVRAVSSTSTADADSTLIDTTTVSTVVDTSNDTLDTPVTSPKQTMTPRQIMRTPRVTQRAPISATTPQNSGASFSSLGLLGFSPRGNGLAGSDQLTSFGLAMSPMPLNGELGLLGDRIQRTMTAFEPAAWDEMDDWIFEA